MAKPDHLYTQIFGTLLIRASQVKGAEWHAIITLTQRLTAYRHKQNQWADVTEAFNKARDAGNDPTFYAQLEAELMRVAE